MEQDFNKLKISKKRVAVFVIVLFGILFLGINLLQKINFTGSVVDMGEVISEDREGIVGETAVSNYSGLCPNGEPIPKNGICGREIGTINPRTSHQNVSGDEVAYVDHAGSMGGVGNVTFNDTTSGGGYGFFAYLGDKIKRILNLEAVDGNFSGSLDVTGTFNSSGTLYVSKGGNVGIGTSNPTQALDVASSTPSNISIGKTSSLSAGETMAYKFHEGSTQLAELKWSGTGNLLTLENHQGTATTLALTGGNVGIGTSSPGQKLEVSDTNAPANISIFRDDTTVVDEDIIGALLFASNDASTGKFIGARIESIAEATHASSEASTGLRFFTTSGASTGERMRIDKDGNVGIGTSSPSSKLEVSGNITITQKVCLDSNCIAWMCYNGSSILISNNDSSVSC